MKKNVLLMVPMHNEKIEWKDSDKIILEIKREGFIHKFMNKAFKTPISPKIELDEIGSFVWKRCDGTKKLYEIAEDMKSYFGDNIEPVYDRLLMYMGILKNNKYIKLR